MAVGMLTTDAHERVAFRDRANRLGLWLFLASEAFLFSAVIAARFSVAGLSRPRDLNQPLGLAITAVLLASSLSAYLAESAAVAGDRRGLAHHLRLTIVFGLAFLVGVGVEWSEGLRSFPPTTAYGSAFFTLVGLHAFHVLTGMAALSIVLGLTRRGRFGPGDTWGIEAVVKYWHFVDVAWVFIFPTLYLVR